VDKKEDITWERHESLPAEEPKQPDLTAEKKEPTPEPAPLTPKPIPKDKDIELESSKSFQKKLVRAKASMNKRFGVFGNLKILTYQGEKTVEEWGEHFTVKVPEDGDTRQLIIAGARCGALYAEAITNLEQASITNLTLKKELTSKEGELFAKIKRQKENNKPPSDRAVQARVDSHPEIVRLKNQLAISAFIVGFWESKKQQLVYTRRTLEMIGYAKGAELKSLGMVASSTE